MKYTWFKNNFVEILALIFVLFAFKIFTMILLKEVKADDTVTTTIVTSVTNIVMLVVGYFYGSSSGSKKKQEQIEEMTKNNPDEKTPTV